MKKRINLSLNQFTLLALAIILVTLILAYSIYAVNNYAAKSSDSLTAFVGAGGNIAGGLIGGIVAYIVAHIQIYSTLENEKSNECKKIASLLKLMKAEFSYNKKLLIEFKSDLVLGKHLNILEQISTQAWQSGSSEVCESLNSDDLETLIKTVTATNTLKTHIYPSSGVSTISIESDIDILCNLLNTTDNMLTRNVEKLTLQTK